MKNTVIAVFIFLLLLAACDNTGNTDTDSMDDDKPFTIAYSANGTDVSQFMNWQWEKKEEGSDLELKWLFKNDGTISVIHCCGLVFDEQFSYLFCGNVLLTYGNDTDSSDKDKIEATVYTMSDNSVSFTRHNGTNFIRGDPYDDSSSASPVVLSNVLLGTWQGADGTKYVFNTDASLRIDSSQYGYLVRGKKLLTLGPLVDGTDVVLREYTFTKTGTALSLTPAEGTGYTLSLVE